MNERLKVQNKAYQEILGRIDSTISEGKRIVKLMGDISVGMFSYNETYYPFDQLNPTTIFKCEKTIFNHLRDEMLYNVEKKKVAWVFSKIYESIDHYLVTEYIHQEHPIKEIEVHWHMVIGMIKSIMTLFEAEFKQNGLTYIEGYDKEKNPIITLVTKDIFEQKLGREKEVGACNEKKLLLQNSLGKVSKYAFVEYGAVTKSDKTVFVLKF